MQSAVKNYLQTQVSTTTQGDLVIMLYDAALKFLHQAKERIAEKNYAQKGILISKALDILAELQGSLNVNKGGELAERLQKLYFFCSTRLLAELPITIPNLTKPVHAVLEADVAGRDVKNSWDFWLFPKRAKQDALGVAVSPTLLPTLEKLYTGLVASNPRSARSAHAAATSFCFESYAGRPGPRRISTIAPTPRLTAQPASHQFRTD